MSGWGSFIENNHLELIQSISLPTAWSFKESDETQYVFQNSKVIAIQIKCTILNVLGRIAQLG